MAARREAITRRWTESDDAQLYRMWIEGVPCKRIARKLHRVKSSVYTRARRLRLPKRSGISEKGLPSGQHDERVRCRADL